MPAGDHTRLMNMFVGLCADTPQWPSILLDLGYRIQLVEPVISTNTAQKVNPDVVAASEIHSHAIVAECKSGKNIDARQDKKYRELDPKHLAQHVTVHHLDKLGIACCYVDTEDNHGRLARHTSLPFITFERHSVRGHGSFGRAQLDEKLSAATTLQNAREPSGLYPFAPDDDDDKAIPHVLAGLVTYLANGIGETGFRITDREVHKEILELAHPYHTLMHSRHRTRLVGKIGAVIGILLDGDEKLREQAARLGQGVDPSAVQKTREACRRLLEKYVEREGMGGFPR